ncbi:MAG: LysR family transcriptional regulator [Pseudomonadota bacterium]
MLRFTLRQLEYFVAVGEAGSIARASEQINVSSPSISSAISQLEREVGLPLFVRQHAQGLSLTQPGREMMEQARTVLREAGSIMDIAADISGRVRGPLSVGCLLTFAQIILPSLRRDFEDGNPDVRIMQKEMDQAGLISALRRAEIDVALTYDLDLPADLQFTGLIKLPPIALMGTGHPLKDAPDVGMEDLVAHPMVLLDLPSSADYFLSLFDPLGDKPQIAERTRDMAVMRSMVANNFGYSIANVRPLSGTAPDGKPVHIVPIRGDVRALRLGFLTAQDARRSNAVRAFIEHGAEMLNTGKLNTLGGQAIP